MSAATANPSSAPSLHLGAPPSMHAHVDGIGQHHLHHDDRPGKSEEMDAEHELDDLNDSKPRKKRRVIKTSDKKFECPQPDCGKSYSRAEHLYRHQLNHTPKQIYYCDFPGCDRQFVRADLCARHKERHTAKGSHLQRKDAFMNSQRAAAASVSGGHPNPGHQSGDSSPPNGMSKSVVESNHAVPSTSSSSSRTTDGFVHHQQQQQQQQQQPGMLQSVPSAPNQYQAHPMPDMNPLRSETGVQPLDPQLSVNNSQYSGYPNSYPPSSQMMPPPQSPGAGKQFNYDGGMGRASTVNGSYAQHPPLPVNSMHPPQLHSQQSGANMYEQQPQYTGPTSSAQQFRPPSSYSNMSVATPFGIQDYGGTPGTSRPGSVMSPQNMGPADQFQMATSRPNNLNEFGFYDNYSAGFAMPVFGVDYYNRSPPTQIDDNLFNQLLENNGIDMNNTSPPPPEPMQMYGHVTNPQIPKVENERSFSNEPPAREEVPRQSPQVYGVNIDIPESDINLKKQGRLVTLLGNFEDIDGPSGRRMKHDVLSGDVADPAHVLSVHMLKTYLTSYWVNIHQQMPILHRPTFNPETCPDLLLLAMICLGACCLERRDMQDMLPKVADLAHFAAHHIRWEVFKDAEFRPTAKLWTFQTMLLLELYEKMYSTRTLHERAHIHHATTLTVMRRGSSLIGRAVESSQSGSDPTRTPPGPDGSINTSGQNTRDAAWNRWITAEATRRVAFAAFVIDSTHATLFGHSAVMAPHDIRLPLPCDEALWSATSMAEVGRVEASLAANGFKPTSFLDGLKKTLNGQKVRTNTFGRGILMAGLLNVSWHMNQRDLQISSLGAAGTLGNPVRWRSPLTRAFDFWRSDFEESLSKNEHWLQVCKSKDNCSIDHRENVFESRTCLHSLAHMAMHVDIVDCEVFAGSDRALGRIVTEADRTAVQRRMRELWAPSARARDATFYAIRFLREVLIPDDEAYAKVKPPSSPDEHPVSHPPNIGPAFAPVPVFRYSARDDYLLNRPYILYFACMIVWSYGYALDGALRSPSPAHHGLHTHDQQVRDMQQYLRRMSSIENPADLEKLEGRNACLGLLLLLQKCFNEPRWELLHEASDMLGACVKLLVPGPVPAPSSSTSTPTTMKGEALGHGGQERRLQPGAIGTGAES